LKIVESLYDFGEILYAEAERHADKGHIQNPRWRTAAILKIVKLPYPIVGF